MLHAHHRRYHVLRPTYYVPCHKYAPISINY